MKLTPEEYVNHAGNDCPGCGSHGSVHMQGYIESDGCLAWANCSCEVCGATWTDTYCLTGYDNFEEGNNNEAAG